MEKISYESATLKKFGLTMAGIIALAAGVIFFKHTAVVWQLPVLALFFFAAGIVAPESLGLTYYLWMRLAVVLAWVNTRVILILMFYLVVTPIGLAMQLFGADLLEKKLKKNTRSYWKKREVAQADKSGYERQF